mmetsp:Transcript_5204/g.7652  ORF Transcript_5204/g.7652 Transcript_5204/m.7652 type:complete len:514 (-) Transcript_5204:522-2063(-)
MGAIFSKKEPIGVKPRDPERVLAASQHVEPIRKNLIELGSKIQGQVLLPSASGNDDGDSGSVLAEEEAYHKQRERPFYMNDCNYPSAIVLVESPQDIAEAVQLMSSLEDKHKYPLCIAGGCHSHYCMVEKSIVLDMEKLNMVTVDKDAKTITMQGGAKIGMAHAALKGTGFGFMTGTNGDTGVSGLTLVGGAGWLGGQAGYACDTVLSAKVVTATGEIVTVTDTNEYKDLLRALRGGGGNFGVVTEWTFQLFDVTNAFGGGVVHFAPTMARLKLVLDNAAKVLEDIPDEGGAVLALPGGAPVFVTFGTMIGSIDQIVNAKSYTDIPFLANLSNLGAFFRMSNDLGRKDYINEIAPMLEPFQQRTYAFSVAAMVYSFDDAIRDTLIHFARVDLPGKNSKPVILVQSLHGKMRRNDGSKSSMRHRKAKVWIIIEGAYEPNATEEEIQNIKDWMMRAKKRIIELGGEDGPHNFCDTDGRRIKFFTDEQRTFLQDTKKKYDPTNCFTLNQNIREHTE